MMKATLCIGSSKTSNGNLAVQREQRHKFPNGAMGSSTMFSYFQENFNFTASEVVTLMGAHSLGMASKSNSGKQTMLNQKEPDQCWPVG